MHPKAILSSTKQLQNDAGHRHFVLVHGAWCWYKVSALVIVLLLWIMAASGVHSKQVHELRSFLDYFEHLMEFMASLPPEEGVVLVGHSMGGIGISVATEKFPEIISAGVLLPQLCLVLILITKLYHESLLDNSVHSWTQNIFLLMDQTALQPPCCMDQTSCQPTSTSSPHLR
ncbi:hypothetical protein P3X46_033985 [Hevea brasiliensis]|uniref:AB hydrolase-1 domain-containing protein n=1 Tax=Hevea brasiliensis TaxID=3981 RepID=A0ABQ9K965_HEVBR|nr:hypothetical protein P3X46_033985 [Hevea brasiliensis]